MKNYGKVLEYNGVYGKVKGVDGNVYILLDKNIIDEEIKESDDVEFDSEVLETTEITLSLARHVKVLRNNKNN